jgi:RNA polymerase sigma-70 factor (ECF subfamily)
MNAWEKDGALLARFRRGEPAALETVYRLYVDHIQHVVRQILGARRDEVADAVQETFARAFTEGARHAYDGVRDYGPFLTTIARNLLVDRARRAWREQSLEMIDEKWRDQAAPDPEPFADYTTMKMVRQYVAQLPSQLRAVHEERNVRAVSQEEAARRLGITRQRLRTLERELHKGLIERLVRAGVSLKAADQPAAAPPAY